MEYTAAVITASDKGSKGERIDKSGELIVDNLNKLGYIVVEKIIVADEEELLYRAIKSYVDKGINLVLTTGGTGFSKRDVTPEATQRVIERSTPGISEAIRMMSHQKTPRAMLSRGISGIAQNTLIINLPGSPKAVSESMEFIMDSVYHGLEILLGDTSECGRR